MSEPLLIIEQYPNSTLGNTERKSVLRTLRDRFKIKPLADKSTSINLFDLPFYSDVDLIEIRDDRWNPFNAKLYFLKWGDSYFPLDGNAPPIHEVNSKADLVIDGGNVLRYLAFFCFFVRGDEGPFFIVDSTKDPYIPHLTQQQTLESVFRPPTIWGQDANGDWRVSALVYYSNAVYYADFLVHLSGMVEMVKDSPLTGELSAAVDAPNQIEGVLAS